MITVISIDIVTLLQYTLFEQNEQVSSHNFLKTIFLATVLTVNSIVFYPLLIFK